MCTRWKPPQAQKQKSNGSTTSALILLTYMTSNGGVEQKLTLREMTISAHNAHSVDNMRWDNRSCSYHELGHNQKCKIYAIRTSGVGDLQPFHLTPGNITQGTRMKDDESLCSKHENRIVEVIRSTNDNQSVGTTQDQSQQCKQQADRVQIQH